VLVVPRQVDSHVDAPVAEPTATNHAAAPGAHGGAALHRA
jgi:hypothetical protein